MNSKKSLAFEQLSRNVYLLEYIFDLLDFPDQLALANISTQFQYIFKNYIWKEKYKKVKIENYLGIIKLTNESAVYTFNLALSQFEYFRNIYSEDMEILNEYHGCAINTKQLQNLTSISYNYLMLTNEHIKLLAINCPKLEKLSIYGCCNKYRDIIQIGTDIKLKTLLQMQRLKHFALRNASGYEMKEDFTSKLKLQYFNLKHLIISDDEAMESGQMEQTDSCLNCIRDAKGTIEDLDIYISFRSSITPHRIKLYANCFENLISLKISIAGVANNEIIATMAKVCQNLRQLEFKSTNFENIEKFSIFANLTDLSFYDCYGLTYDNLREILTEMKLNAFTSVDTKYKGVVFHYYFISPTIKSFHIDALKSFEFKTASDYYKT